MADAIGVKRNTWSNYENLVSQPDIDTIIGIANYFDIAIDSLIKEDLSVDVHLLDSIGSTQKTEKSTPNSTPNGTPNPKNEAEISGFEGGKTLNLLIATKEQLIRSLQATIDTQQQLIYIQNQQLTSLLEENTRLKREIPEIGERMEDNSRGGSKTKIA